MAEKEENGIMNFINNLTKLTVRIVSMDNDRKLKGLSSGFLYQPDTNYPPIVITAGHKTPEKGCFIETRIKKEGEPLCISSGEFKVFYNNDDIDFAYSYLPHDTFEASPEGDITAIELLPYRHSFIKAVKNEAYGFAVWNDYAEFIRTVGNKHLLHRYCCCEVGMELVKQNDHINYFKTSRLIQDHEYYKGASGSPIADPEGAITSILIGGTEPKKHLKATRLDNIDLPTNKPVND